MTDFVGFHTILHSADAAADRAFFRDVFGLPAADAGGGWLIFALPAPGELACHPIRTAAPSPPGKKQGSNAPSESHRAMESHQEGYFMVRCIAAFLRAMKNKGVHCDAVTEASWGVLTHVTLPSGARLGVYEPRHARPPAPALAAAPAASTQAAKPKAKGKAPAKKPSTAVAGKKSKAPAPARKTKK